MDADANVISKKQGKLLLALARQTIEEQLGIAGNDDNKESLQQALNDKIFQKESGTFVTLKKNGQLRGCIGTISPMDSIASGVKRNAVNAAFNDSRFPTLTKDEFPDIDIEVSILTNPQPLSYTDGNDLLQKLQPIKDGVIIRSGMHSATFLPQVWEQLPQPEDFLSRLCMKAGLYPNAWQKEQLEVLIYHVQYFEE